MGKQGYHFVGKHSAVKICEYAANGLRDKTLCYKNLFYGIKSWKCMQATPAVGCDLSCRFCWRIIPEEFDTKWNELNKTSWDEPRYIAENMIKEQQRIVSGFKSIADTDLKMRRWKEANSPMHVALSLTGEPTFYPYLSELLKEFHKRKMSTFVVSNGTLPEAIERLELMPTQFYISLQAPDSKTYMNVVRPKIGDAWKRFLKSLEFMSTLKTRTALRMTLVKGLNMGNMDGYVKLIGMAKPNYVEVKGFSFVGGAREKERGLSLFDMPNNEEIAEFAHRLAESTGYIETDEHKLSRIVLLSRDKNSKDSRKINFDKI